MLGSAAPCRASALSAPTPSRRPGPGSPCPHSPRPAPERTSRPRARGRAPPASPAPPRTKPPPVPPGLTCRRADEAAFFVLKPCGRHEIWRLPASLHALKPGLACFRHPRQPAFDPIALPTAAQVLRSRYAAQVIQAAGWINSGSSPILPRTSSLITSACDMGRGPHVSRCFPLEISGHRGDLFPRE